MADEGVRDHLQKLLTSLDLKVDAQADGDAGRPVHAEGAGASLASGHAESFDGERIVRLEQRLAALAAENGTLSASLAAEQQAHASDVAELQRRLSEDVQQVVQRQEQVEKQGPVLSAQIDTVKRQLGALVISDARYAELQSLRPEQRSLADEVRLCMHDGLLQLRQENEALRVSAQASHEAQSRLEDEVTGLRRDNARLRAAAGDAAAAADSDVGALSARIERLERDVVAATVAAEVNEAKAALYDEVAAHARSLEERNRALLATEAAKGALDEDLKALRETHKDREHRLEMLAMDKAYLTRENEGLEARLAAAAAERDAATAQLRDAKQRHDAVCEKLLESHEGYNAGLEARVQTEVQRVHEAARADTAALRAESQAALERETRLLREARDAAHAESERLRADVKDCRGELDDVTLRYRTLQRTADVDGTALAAQVKLRAADAERAQVRALELEAQLQQVVGQNDLLHDKVRVLTDSFYFLEAEHTRAVAALGANLAATSGQSSHHAAGEPAAARPMLSVGEARRVEEGVALAGRCADLERERGTLAREAAALQRELDAAKRELGKHEAAARGPAGPQSYLMQELRGAEARARTAEAAADEARAALLRRTQELQGTQSKLELMQRDLQEVLEQRAVLNSVKSGLRASMAGLDGPLSPLENRL